MQIFDGHNDTLLHIHDPERGKGRTFFAESGFGHIDLPRAVRGGLAGGVFAIFTPPPPDSPERDPRYGLTVRQDGYEVLPRSAIHPAYAREFTDAVLGTLQRIEADSRGKVRVVRAFEDLEACLASGALAIVLGFEGAEAIHADLSNLEAYYRAGLRVLGLVWSRPNAFAEGTPFRFPGSPDTGAGLTPAGRELVRACNRLGIVIDLAHLNARGFHDVAELSSQPLVVTHANVHALCPSARNLTDDQIDAVGRTGGVIGINFEVRNTRPDGLSDPRTPLLPLVAHIAYVIDRIGIDHVAFGSDFDGAGMPEALRDASCLPNLIRALEEAGFDSASIRKIALDNWRRVFRSTWKTDAPPFAVR